MSDDKTINTWCREHGLLATTMKCAKMVPVGVEADEEPIMGECGGDMAIGSPGKKAGSEMFRCLKNRNHEKTFKCNSVFEKGKTDVRDYMLFLKCYLDKHSLLQCANFSGISYHSTAVKWAQITRKLFMEYCHVNIKNRQLIGEIVIDESFFGRKMKYHRGNPSPGLKIWIFWYGGPINEHYNPLSSERPFSRYTHTTYSAPRQPRLNNFLGWLECILQLE